MRFAKLECVVLAHDVPEHGLQAGDLGAVVEVYPQGGLEVEFIRASGATQALLTLSEQDVRKIDPRDLMATRRLAEVK
ncbi:MAG: DUF4926 domain-containing protein [Chloroflexi bacterium]|nr:DUF4926 domain-containing protein [Chloroflexota bacterium]